MHDPHDHQTEAFWDRMYAHRTKPWDPKPNAVLAEVAETLPPGRAYDVGCGEGADALWLARRGWTVTASDFSAVALGKARAQDPEGRVAWRQADMHAAAPAGPFDLVSAHYLHVPPAERAAFFGGLAAAVAPGGTLVVVAHHPSDHQSGVGRPAIADLYFTADEVLALLPPGWTAREAGTRPLEVTSHAGEKVMIQDMVLVATRP